MFSEKSSMLAKQYDELWCIFTECFTDIAIPIRVKCIQCSVRFLLNHPELRNDIIDAMKHLQHDANEIVRYELCNSILETAKLDFRLVFESADLLGIVKERTADKMFTIRQEAINILIIMYKIYSCEFDTKATTKNMIIWIKNDILHRYYMTDLMDRLLVERFFIDILVQYRFPAKNRMENLYRFFATLDGEAIHAFTELQRNQLKLRKTVSVWVKLHRTEEYTPKIQKEINFICQTVSK